MANDLGNLVYRSLTMVEKYFQGQLPENYNKKVGTALFALAEGLTQVVDKEMRGYNFSQSLARIWTVINSANKFIEDTKPWVLFKEKKEEELKDFIFVLTHAIKKVQLNLEAFMPQTAEAIKKQFNNDKIKKEKPLFPRIENVD